MSNSFELLIMIIAHTKRICVIALASIVFLAIIGGPFLSVNAQRPDSNRLPVLLIHVLRRILVFGFHGKIGW